MDVPRNGIPVRFNPMVGMLEMVAFKKGMIGAVADSWVEAVRLKLADVGVLTLRDFVRYVLRINRMLRSEDHRIMHQATLNMMLAEVCEMLFDSEEE
jgi:hypothetical protein